MEVFLSQKELDTVKRAIDIYGVKNQEDVAIEEMSELTKAIIKNRRYNTEETRANISEEIVDVQIMLNQLLFCYGVPSNLYTEKLDRLARSLDETNKTPKTYFDLIKTASCENLAKIISEIFCFESCIKNFLPPEMIQNLKKEYEKEFEKILKMVVE